MNSAFFFLAGLVLFWVGAVLILSALKSSGKSGVAYRPCRLQSENEIEFFGRITQAVPEYRVFVQVSMAALIEPALNKTRLNNRQWWSAFGAISQQRVDYVVADRNMNIIAVIELDDRSHDTKRPQDLIRDLRLNRAGIQTIRYESKHKPEVCRLRSELLALSQRIAA
jgi:very-short-patch-repair endonuclease